MCIYVERKISKQIGLHTDTEKEISRKIQEDVSDVL